METTAKKEFTLKEKTNKYDGILKVDEVVLTYGDKEYKREVLNTTNSVAAIVKDINKNKYIFVEQYRAGAEGLMVEVVAGGIEKGETPEEAIKREVMEETGYKVDFSTPIYDFYYSPGKSTEICSMFYVEVSEQINEGGGIGGENINLVEVEKLGLNGKLFFTVPMAELKEYDDNNLIPPYQLIDAKSIIAVNWMETSNTLREMSEVITQSKIRSL